MKIVPRDYQHQAHDCIFDEWTKLTSTLVVLPTGGGKTILFALVIKTLLSQQPGKRIMVVAHREELIWQARKKIEAVAEVNCDVEMGEVSAGASLFGVSPVIVSTVQTQNSNNGVRKRMGKFDPKDFSALVIDEGHHATSPSYKNLINYYKTNNPEIKILFVTATPDRSDEEALGQMCDSVAFDYEILDAIKDGWLVPVEQQFVKVSGLDFSSVRTTAGDLNGADLARVMESEGNMQGVASASIEIIGDRPTIVFTSSVNQAEVVCNILNRHRPGMAAWVCGETDKDIRRTTNAMFEEGKIQVLCNCGIYTEGYDNPLVSAIVMARPTESRSLYSQMAGRAMRPLPGVVDPHLTAVDRLASIAASPKPSCLLIDFVGNSGKHKLMTTADILGGNVSDEAIQRAIAKTQKKGGAVRMAEELEEAQEDIRKEAEARRLADEARKNRIVAKAKYHKQSVNPFDLFQLAPIKERGWDSGKQLSEKQRSLLLKQGINPDELSYAKGKQILNEMFRRWNAKLATLGQMRVLARYGYTDKNTTFEQASGIINALAKNNWKR